MAVVAISGRLVKESVLAVLGGREDGIGNAELASSKFSECSKIGVLGRGRLPQLDNGGAWRASRHGWCRVFCNSFQRLACVIVGSAFVSLPVSARM
jgi:hypothetical protein